MWWGVMGVVGGDGCGRVDGCDEGNGCSGGNGC